MKKHLQVVGAVFLKDGEILAARRGNSKFAYVAHKYEFAGGKIEEGESPEQALVREIREELCADVRVDDPFLSLDYEYPDFSISLQLFYCTFLSPFQITEHESLNWLPIKELDEEEWAPADIPAVRKLKDEV